MKICVEGGKKLEGSIRISGSKNASLPLLASSILSGGDMILSNLPELSDIRVMCDLLSSLGMKINLQEQKDKGLVASLDSKSVENIALNSSLVSKIRASILLLGPLLAKFHEAIIPFPGGCPIGERPIDLHIEAMQKFGVTILFKNDCLIAKAKKIVGTKLFFPKISVGATENIIMLAVLAEGDSVLNNVAIEPEVIDLCLCLNKMGARIRGIGTRTLCIQGVSRLYPVEYKVMPDRIEAGTYAIASAITKGSIILEDIEMKDFFSISNAFNLVGVDLHQVEKGILIRRTVKKLNNVVIRSRPYPGFPTDMQAPFMALLATIQGESRIIESIFENRFMHVEGLVSMGANIKYYGNTAIINGVKSFISNKVNATDLRASVAFIIAALTAEGSSEIGDLHHLDRGYENLEYKLQNCGANIKRVRVV